MGSSINTYRKRIAISGGDLRTSKIKSSRLYLEKTIKDDPSYYRAKVRGTYLDCRIYDSNSKSNERGRKNIMTPIHQPFYVGDIIEVTKAKKKFLCTYSEEYHEIYNTGHIEECNYVLRWKDSRGNIKETECVINETGRNNLGIEEKQMIVYGNTRLLVTVPFNRDTCRIKEDKRFLIDYNTIDPRAYKVTTIDTVTNHVKDHGVIYFIVEQCARNINDNVDLMIADYFTEENDVTDDSDDEYYDEPRATISYPSSYITIGKIAKLEVEFANVEDIDDPLWSVVSEIPVKVIDMIDNYVEIKVDFNLTYIGQKIKVLVSDKNSTCQDEIVLEIRGVV